MALILGFVNGMDLAIQNNVTLYSGGHVLVSGYTASQSGRLQNRFADDTVVKIVESSKADILTVSPIAQSRATVVFGTREIQLMLRGIDWSRDRLYHESLILTEGDWKGLEDSRTMLMSGQTAERFGLAAGDRVIVRLSTASGQQNVTDYKVVAIYDDGAAGGMNTAFVAFGDLATDLNMRSNEQQQIAVFLKNSAAAEEAAQALSAGLSAQGFTVHRGSASNDGAQASVNRRLTPGTAIYHISTVQELAGEIGAALGSIRWIGYAVFALMLLVSATGISNSYHMVLLERTKEIGMLRCIGYKKRTYFLLSLGGDSTRGRRCSGRHSPCLADRIRHRPYSFRSTRRFRGCACTGASAICTYPGPVPVDFGFCDDCGDRRSLCARPESGRRRARRGTEKNCIVCSDSRFEE